MQKTNLLFGQDDQQILVNHDQNFQLTTNLSSFAHAQVKVISPEDAHTPLSLNEVPTAHLPALLLEFGEIIQELTEEDPSTPQGQPMIASEGWIEFSYQLQLDEAAIKKASQTGHLSWDFSARHEQPRNLACLALDDQGFPFWLFNEDTDQPAADALLHRFSVPIPLSEADIQPTATTIQPFHRLHLKMISVSSEGESTEVLPRLLYKIERMLYARGLGFGRMTGPIEPLVSLRGRLAKWKKRSSVFKPAFSNWQPLEGKPCLLIIHGTIADDYIAFNGLGRWTQVDGGRYDELYQHYEGRIISFNHYTLADSAEDNAQKLVHELLAKIPRSPGQRFDLQLDVLTRSRGANVLRHLVTMKEQLSKQGIHLSIGKVFSVAPPHFGTPLADPGRLKAYLQFHTFFLYLLPSSTALTVLLALSGIAIAVARNLKSLPGIQSMSNRSLEFRELVKKENALLQAGEVAYTEWASYISNYQPTAGLRGKILQRLAIYLADRTFVDNFFDEANDMVIPVSSALTEANKPRLPGSRTNMEFSIPPQHRKSGPESFNHLTYVKAKGDKGRPQYGDEQLLDEIVSFFTVLPPPVT
ncbi:MAG: hypothetical protein AAFR61_14235 [Bacteroidota bacterium]